MGKLTNLNPPKAIADADIPPEIARDTETEEAVIGHVAAPDPHPIYLSEVEGDARYSKIKSKIFDGTTLTNRTGFASVTHGLDSAKVAGFTCIIELYSGIWYPFAGLPQKGEFVFMFLSSNTISVGCGFTITAPVLGKAFRILVFYS